MENWAFNQRGYRNMTDAELLEFAKADIRPHDTQPFLRSPEIAPRWREALLQIVNDVSTRIAALELERSKTTTPHVVKKIEEGLEKAVMFRVQARQRLLEAEKLLGIEPELIPNPPEEELKAAKALISQLTNQLKQAKEAKIRLINPEESEQKKQNKQLEGQIRKLENELEQIRASKKSTQQIERLREQVVRQNQERTFFRGALLQVKDLLEQDGADRGFILKYIETKLNKTWEETPTSEE